MEEKYYLSWVSSPLMGIWATNANVANVNAETVAVNVNVAVAVNANVANVAEKEAVGGEQSTTPLQCLDQLLQVLLQSLECLHCLHIQIHKYSQIRKPLQWLDQLLQSCNLLSVLKCAQDSSTPCRLVQSTATCYLTSAVDCRTENMVELFGFGQNWSYFVVDNNQLNAHCIPQIWI